jgi:hypothetical protein
MQNSWFRYNEDQKDSEGMSSVCSIRITITVNIVLLCVYIQTKKNILCKLAADPIPFCFIVAGTIIDFLCSHTNYCCCTMMNEILNAINKNKKRIENNNCWKTSKWG